MTIEQVCTWGILTRIQSHPLAQPHQATSYKLTFLISCLGCVFSLKSLGCIVQVVCSLGSDYWVLWLLLGTGCGVLWFAGTVFWVWGHRKDFRQERQGGNPLLSPHGAVYGGARRANGTKSDNKCGHLNDEPSAPALVPIYMRDLPNLGSLPNSGYLSTGYCTATTCCVNSMLQKYQPHSAFSSEIQRMGWDSFTQNSSY